jgi:hypothetical protein
MGSKSMSRRRFVRGSIRLAIASPLVHFAPVDALAQSSRLDTAARRTLGAAADAIIPTDGRMPAPTAVGVLRYIERIAGADARVTDLLHEGLRALEAQAMASDANRFDLLSAEQQAAVLGHIERTDVPAGFFPVLRDLVYEAYYTQPRVMKLLGYNFRGGRRRTAPIEPFDEEQIGRVRKMAPFYRRVDP